MKYAPTFKEFLIEQSISRGDPAMDDYYAPTDFQPGSREESDELDQQNAIGDAPYFVGWSGQSHEWYGDDDMKNGRYKPKGDGGRIVYTNVPTYEEAQKLADELDSKYHDGKFEDQFVYGKDGDGYMVDYHGAYVRSMSEMDDWDRESLKYHKPKDMGGEQA